MVCSSHLVFTLESNLAVPLFLMKEMPLVLDKRLKKLKMSSIALGRVYLSYPAPGHGKWSRSQHRSSGPGLIDSKQGLNNHLRGLLRVARRIHHYLLSK